MELPNYIWALKKDKIVTFIKWTILSIAHGKPASNYCRLFLRMTAFDDQATKVYEVMLFDIQNYVYSESVFNTLYIEIKHKS